LLEQSPPFLGDGHRVSLIAHRGPRFFMFPDRTPAAMFALLPMGVPPGLRDEALRAVSAMHDTLIAAGGKRYLSGWFGMMDEAAWRDHYGVRYDEWVTAKHRFDPAGVFTSVAFPSRPLMHLGTVLE
jgi:cytokinin dehydrogenase